MVRHGPRPAHRKGTVGAAWRAFRSVRVNKATHCQNPTCGKPLVRDAICGHPTHQALGYCPTYHAYPTLEHPHRLVDGGRPRDPANALVYCYECNSRGGGPRPRQAKDAGASRVW